MTGSAQLEIPTDETLDAAGPGEEQAPSALKLEVAERLAAHRRRRASRTVVAAGTGAELIAGAGRGRQTRVAAAVAERYAQTPSYRAFLAQEAERATERAAAAAQVAARNAEAVAAVQQELLAELKLWDAPQEFTPETAAGLVVATAGAQQEPHSAAAPEKPGAKLPHATSGAGPAASAPVREVSNAGLTVRLYEDAGQVVARPEAPPRAAARAHAPDAAEVQALEEEITFRQAPVFEEYRPKEPAVPLPANLLEFPRQLVATVKARPRLAEGPLRDESASRSPQLRIFEVEPEQIASAPEPVSLVPEWSSIWLDAHTVTAAEEDADLPAMAPSLLPPQTAAVHLRVMAACVDALLVLGAFCAFAAVFAKVAGTVVWGLPLAEAAAGLLVIMYLLFQVMFFTLSGQTPGMRYARIGLCTFSDENPSRSAMRKRVLAEVVAVVPLGLGVLWALLDDERLGWHDRISRMYQRVY